LILSHTNCCARATGPPAGASEAIAAPRAITVLRLRTRVATCLLSMAASSLAALLDECLTWATGKKKVP
jgi:hypothetical protein